MKKSALIILAFLCQSYLYSQVSVTPAGSKLPERKPLIVQTLLVNKGKPNGIIVTPGNPEFQQLARKVQSAIQTATGAKLNIITSDKIASQRGELLQSEPGEHIITLGSLENNGLIAHLYFRAYCPVDATYPGKEGYIIQTVSDPWGKGANVIVLGGSTVIGVEKAVGIFSKDLPKGNTLTISRALKYENSRNTISDPTDKEIADILVQSAKDFKSGKQGGLFNPIVGAANSYSLSGNEGQAKLFRELLFLEYDLKTNSPAAFDSPWGGAADFLFAPLIAAWDKVEESPSFTGEDREKILKIILEYIHFYETYAYIPAFKTSIIRHNHHTFPGQGFMAAGLYFTKYYPDYAEGKKWLEMGDNCFRVQQQSWKSQEDCSAYAGIASRHMCFYATARPDFTWFDSGRANIAGDLAIITMDNLGYQCNFGDIDGFQPRKHMDLWNSLAMIERNGRYSWAIHKSYNASGFNNRPLNMPVHVDPVEPTDLLGTKCVPMDSLFYVSLNGKGTVPLKQSFDKISFRSSFDPQRQYMAIDGINVGYHGHRDGNSVLRLTDRGRIWLAEGDYIKSSPKYHNTLLIFRDGEASAMPPFVRRELVADLPSVGMTRTTTPAYGGTDWTRNIIWDKDRAFIFIDEVKANSDESYNIQTHWHTLGVPELNANTFSVSQQGEQFWIQNLDGSRLRSFKDVETGKNWVDYKYADPVINTLQQLRSSNLHKGDKLYVINVMSADSDGKVPIKAVRVNDSSLMLGSGNDQVLIGVDGISTADLETDAQLYWLGNSRLALGGVKRLSLHGKAIFEAADSISAELTSDGVIFNTDKNTTVTFFGKQPVMKGVSVKPVVGTHTFTFDLPAGKHVFSALALPSKFITAFPKASPASSVVTSFTASDKLIEKAEFTPGNSNGSRPLAAGINGLYVGGSDSILYALTTDAKVRWTYNTKSNITAAWTGKLAKDTPERIVVGNSNGKIAVLDQSGRLVWEQRVPLYKDKQSVTYFTSADLAGDGNRSLIAGGDNWYHYAYDSKGKMQWEYLSLHGSSTGAATDLDGDGKQEVIAGTEYYSWHAINPDGKAKWSVNRVGPFAYDIVAADLSGTGKPTVYIAGGDGNLYAIGADGKRLWTYNTGDGATTIELMDVDNDGKEEILVGTLNASLIALKPNGTRLWRKDVSEPVRSMTQSDLDGDGKAEIVVGTEDGHVIALNRDGKLIANWNTEGSVNNLISFQKGRVAASTGNGKVVVLGMAEK